MRPEYEKGSLVNLVRSIEAGLAGTAQPEGTSQAVRQGPGAQAACYRPLERLDPDRLGDRPVIVLFVVDGLGYNRLGALPPSSALRKALNGAITSVFPSTTASAVTSLFTGVAPLQHGLTGWHVWEARLQQTITPLPFVERLSGDPLPVSPQTVFAAPSMMDRLPVPSYLILPHYIRDSVYSTWHGGPATRIGYRKLDGLFAATLELVHGTARGFIHAYWPEFDAISHGHGTWSEAADEALEAFDQRFAAFLDACPPGRVNVLLTADHGFVDPAEESRISMHDHPELTSMLRRPVCGEPRVAYLYPKPGSTDEVGAYVRERLAFGFSSHPARELVEGGLFGLGAAEPCFDERIGPWVLIARDDHVLGDGCTAPELVFKLLGFHGGTSEDEMLVPLVFAQP